MSINRIPRIMNETEPQLSDQFKTNLNEINNNLDWMRKKKDSNVTFSSVSSYEFISNEESSSKLERKSSLQDVIHKAEDNELVSFLYISYWKPTIRLNSLSIF